MLESNTVTNEYGVIGDQSTLRRLHQIIDRLPPSTTLLVLSLWLWCIDAMNRGFADVE